MNDLISRQDVIELAKNSYYNLAESTEDTWAMVADVERLPSAQPELIRCKDCARYGEPECLMAYDGKHWAEDDGFCHAGERGEQDG